MFSIKLNKYLFSINFKMSGLKNLEIIKGDILESKADVIVHQCNCITNNAKGLAYKINNKFPYADIYKNRTTADTPGTCKLQFAENLPIIACLLGQYYPGKVKGYDSADARVSWFSMSLTDLSNKLENLEVKTIAFPGNIGCGLAGGDWDTYYAIIQKFAENNSKYEIKIYELEN